MFETEAEMTALQALLDTSMKPAGDHLRGIVTDERLLSALQVATYLQGVKHVTLATVNSKGEPIAAPLDGWFLHGKFIVSTGSGSLRLKHIRARPAVSACHLDGDNVGIWVHGTARILERGEALEREYDEAATKQYGSSPYSWGEDIAIMVIEPRVMFAYAFAPENYPPTK
jgi:uncharacterized pyridoxamine 5'-phosphate oxidase family protein